MLKNRNGTECELQEFAPLPKNIFEEVSTVPKSFFFFLSNSTHFRRRQHALSQRLKSNEQSFAIRHAYLRVNIQPCS